MAQPQIPPPKSFASLLSLEGRCAIVTGGSRGIGKEIVKRFAEAGASVIFTGRGQQPLTLLEEEVAAAGGKAAGVQADASSLEDSRKVVDFAVKRFGRLDILVNSAAIFHACLALEVPESLWDTTLDTDLKGPFFLAKVAAEAMVVV